AGTAWLAVVLQNDSSVLVEADVGTIWTTGFLLGANDDSANDLALLYVAAWGGFLDSCDNGVANASETSYGSAKNADAQNFTCTRVISDAQTRFFLNHYGSPDLDYCVPKFPTLTHAVLCFQCPGGDKTHKLIRVNTVWFGNAPHRALTAQCNLSI